MGTVLGEVPLSRKHGARNSVDLIAHEQPGAKRIASPSDRVVTVLPGQLNAQGPMIKDRRMTNAQSN